MTSPIAVGLGFRRGCAERELVRVVSEALARAGRPLDDVQALCAPDWKHAEAGLIAAAATLGKSLLLLPLAALARQSPQALTHSPAVLARFGVPSIAETAALAGVEVITGGTSPFPRPAGKAVGAPPFHEVRFAHAPHAISETPSPLPRTTCARLLGPRHGSAVASCALASLSEMP